MNDAATPGHVCPGIRIHAIDIVQPPGIGIPPIADIDTHENVVSAALTTNNSAEAPTTTASSLALTVLIVTPPPATLHVFRSCVSSSLIAPLGAFR
jgi:hypothetical protein